MIRRWWRSLGFYWQVYLFMALAFGGIITFVEAVMEPFVLDPIVARFAIDDVWAEAFLWLASVLLPSLLLGFFITNMVMRKLRTTVEMAQKLSFGDLKARIATNGDDKDVFNQLAKVFNGMADSLERLLYYEKRLLADISHELRSPLTRMGVAIALLPMQRDSDAFDTTIQLIESEIGQMNQMVALLLEQGRERLNNKNEYGRVDLARLVGEVSEGYELTATSESKSISLDIEPELAVWGHEIRIRMIIDNILANALFYAPEHSKIEVSGKRMGQRAFLAVRDFGSGVPDEHLHDIFKAFFRVDQSRARTSGGAGLGLALAKDAAVAMGGDIEARNASPGLEILVTLPLDLSGGGGKVDSSP